MVSLGVKPCSASAFFTILKPPCGFIARFNNSSVCKPTIISKSLLIYPGANAVIDDTVSVSTERKPFCSRSSLSALQHIFHNCVVRSVGPTKKEELPVYGVIFKEIKSLTLIELFHAPVLKSDSCTM